jgi:formylglycine-generating enzyme required for sulfatase activity
MATIYKIIPPEFIRNYSDKCGRLPRPTILKTGDKFKDCECCPDMIALPNGSAISKYEISRLEYDKFVNDNRNGVSSNPGCFVYKIIGTEGDWIYDDTINWTKPGFTQKDDEPVVCVSWNDAKSYVGWLSKKSGVSYSIPTNEELLLAADADGSSNVLWTGDETACMYANTNDQQSHIVNRFPWEFATCNDGYPQILASGGIRQLAGRDEAFRPNKFGIYHLIGNVYEWSSTGEGCTTAGLTWVWGGSWNAAPDKARAVPGWCQSKLYKAVDIGIRVSTKKQ